MKGIKKQIEEILKRLEALEKMAHPKCGIESFDGYAKIDERITKLEGDYDRWE